MDSTRFNWEGETALHCSASLGFPYKKQVPWQSFQSCSATGVDIFMWTWPPHVLLQRLFVPSLCISTKREAQGAISKSTASALFSVLLQGIHGNDFPILFWGRHGIHCNTVSSTKIVQNSSTGWLFFIQKACSTAGCREQAPFNPPTKPGISQQVCGSCFPAGFHGRGGQPASPADTKPLPKVLGNGGRWWSRGGQGWAEALWQGDAGGRQLDKILTWLQEQGWFGDVRAKDGWHVWICDARGLTGKSCLPRDGKSLELLKA